MVTDGSDIAETLISYFTNVVKSLETPDSEKIDQFYEGIKTPTSKTIVKLKKKHPSVTAMNDSFANQSFFPTIEEKDVINEVNKLKSRKALHDTDTLVKRIEIRTMFFGLPLHLS